MKLAVIGHPVSHSLSPHLFACISRETGRELTYGTEEVRLEELADFLARAKAGAYDGCNVTMPLKTETARLAEEKTEEVRRLGASNTVRFAEGKAFAHNTDGAGFLSALRMAGAMPEDGRAVIIGAGGAARAVALALAESGAEVCLVDRTAAHAQSAAQLHPRIRVAEKGDLATAELLINATPCGMTVPWRDLHFLEELPGGATVFDCVYAPRETELTRAAKARGLAAYNGLPMLAGQALAAAEFFLGVPLDVPELLPRLLRTIPPAIE